MFKQAFVTVLSPTGVYFTKAFTNFEILTTSWMWRNSDDEPSECHYSFSFYFLPHKLNARGKIGTFMQTQQQKKRLGDR